MRGVGEGGRPPTSFPPVTSTNLGMRHQKFLSLSFNPVTQVPISKY